MVRINVSDAVNPGGTGRRNPKGQRETTVKQMVLGYSNCKKEVSKKPWSAESLPLLHVVPTLNLSVAVSQTLPLNQTPINLTAVLSRAAVFSSISSQCAELFQILPTASCVMLCKMCTCACTENNSVMERPEKQRVVCNVRPDQGQKK